VIGWDLDRFQRDLLLDSLQEATATYWDRRAEQLAEALPRPDDLQGAAPDTTAPTRINAQILACQRHAALLRGDN
jgi:hypothetical protein